jgi:hypothetical protein
MILRPPEYLEDVRERELEMHAAEARLSQFELVLCPHCDYRIEHDFIRCPSCLRKLKERCVSCSRPLDRSWTICPYCEADVPGLKSSRPRRRRSAEPMGDATSDLEIPLSTDAEQPPGEPVAAAEPKTRSAPAREGRASRPGGRTRPTS